jgi:chromosome segregation ATPase
VGLFNVIKSAILEDDSPEHAKAPPVQQGRPLQAAPGQAPAPSAPAVENEFVSVLRQVVKGRQTAYTALLAADDRLVNVIPDRTMRLKAAFEMVKGDGRDLPQLMAAIDVHLTDLSSQKLSFGQALERKKAEACNASQAELDAIAPANQAAQDSIKQLEAQMQALKDQINQRNQRATELQAKLQADARSYDSKQQLFNTALALVNSEISNQKTIISSALQS